MESEPKPDITLLEFGRLEDEILDGIVSGECEFRTVELAERADLSMAKVNEAMLHLSRKHAHVDDIGGGAWRIEHSK